MKLFYLYFYKTKVDFKLLSYRIYHLLVQNIYFSNER